MDEEAGSAEKPRNAPVCPDKARALFERAAAAEDETSGGAGFFVSTAAELDPETACLRLNANLGLATEAVLS